MSVFILKKLLFKFMELGLGLRTCFSLETKDPIFVNFRLSEAEAEKVRRHLPSGFRLEKIRFCQTDESPEYWISYNLYELKYPKKELQHIHKVRCEINTFVTDPAGRKGVYVFCGSPYVSREERPSFFGMVCDFAERLVVFIYGCGRLTRLKYRLEKESLSIELHEGENRLNLQGTVRGGEERLSDDYWRFNDISFFNDGKSFDLVNVNSAFFSAKFQEVSPGDAKVEGPFFHRAPDCIYVHRGEIAYIVNSMNPMPVPAV